jgi:hypothetical protein
VLRSSSRSALLSARGASVAQAQVASARVDEGMLILSAEHEALIGRGHQRLGRLHAALAKGRART